MSRLQIKDEIRPGNAPVPVEVDGGAPIGSPAANKTINGGKPKKPIMTSSPKPRREMGKVQRSSDVTEVIESGIVSRMVAARKDNNVSNPPPGGNQEEKPVVKTKLSNSSPKSRLYKSTTFLLPDAAGSEEKVLKHDALDLNDKKPVSNSPREDCKEVAVAGFKQCGDSLGSPTKNVGTANESVQSNFSKDWDSKNNIGNRENLDGVGGEGIQNEVMKKQNILKGSKNQEKNYRLEETYPGTEDSGTSNRSSEKLTWSPCSDDLRGNKSSHNNGVRFNILGNKTITYSEAPSDQGNELCDKLPNLSGESIELRDVILENKGDKEEAEEEEEEEMEGRGSRLLLKYKGTIEKRAKRKKNKSGKNPVTISEEEGKVDNRKSDLSTSLSKDSGICSPTTENKREMVERRWSGGGGGGGVGYDDIEEEELIIDRRHSYGRDNILLDIVEESGRYCTKESAVSFSTSSSPASNNKGANCDYFGETNCSPSDLSYPSSFTRSTGAVITAQPTNYVTVTDKSQKDRELFKEASQSKLLAPDSSKSSSFSSSSSSSCSSCSSSSSCSSCSSSTSSSTSATSVTSTMKSSVFISSTNSGTEPLLPPPPPPPPSSSSSSSPSQLPPSVAASSPSTSVSNLPNSSATHNQTDREIPTKPSVTESKNHPSHTSPPPSPRLTTTTPPPPPLPTSYSSDALTQIQQDEYSTNQLASSKIPVESNANYTTSRSSSSNTTTTTTANTGTPTNNTTTSSTNSCSRDSCISAKDVNRDDNGRDELCINSSQSFTSVDSNWSLGEPNLHPQVATLVPKDGVLNCANSDSVLAQGGDNKCSSEDPLQRGGIVDEHCIAGSDVCERCVIVDDEKDTNCDKNRVRTDTGKGDCGRTNPDAGNGVGDDGVVCVHQVVVDIETKGTERLGEGSRSHQLTEQLQSQSDVQSKEGRDNSKSEVTKSLTNVRGTVGDNGEVTTDQTPAKPKRKHRIAFKDINIQDVISLNPERQNLKGILKTKTGSSSPVSSPEPETEKEVVYTTTNKNGVAVEKFKRIASSRSVSFKKTHTKNTFSYHNAAFEGEVITEPSRRPSLADVVSHIMRSNSIVDIEVDDEDDNCHPYGRDSSITELVYGKRGGRYPMDPGKMIVWLALAIMIVSLAGGIIFMSENYNLTHREEPLTFPQQHIITTPSR